MSKTANGPENWDGKAALIWRGRRWQRNRGQIGGNPKTQNENGKQTAKRASEGAKITIKLN